MLWGLAASRELLRLSFYLGVMMISNGLSSNNNFFGNLIIIAIIFDYQTYKLI